MADSKTKSAVSSKDAATEEQSMASGAVPAEADPTEEWVFTMSSLTGEIAKVEKIDKATGQRQEISEEEYAALSGYADPNADPYAAYYAEYGYDPYAEQQAAEAYAVYEAGYYQAAAEYEAVLAGLTSGSGYTPEEEAAYLQGLADYEALLG
jgi:hypothetical protein